MSVRPSSAKPDDQVPSSLVPFNRGDVTLKIPTVAKNAKTLDPLGDNAVHNKCR